MASNGALKGPLPRLLVLYGLLYGAFGASSPFMPAFIRDHGVNAASLGVVLAAGTATRFVAGPAAGWLADRFHALRAMLAIAITCAALAVLLYLGVRGFPLLLAVSVIQAAALAPVTPLADAIALNVQPQSTGSQGGYGIVRGSGSLAFIAGTALAGPAIDAFSFSAAVLLNAALLALAAVAVAFVPPVSYVPRDTALLPQHADRQALVALLRLPVFRRLMLLAALILGSHALHDGFAVIRWRDAGIDGSTIGLLWSEAVGAEVVVFFIVGPWALRRFAPGHLVTFVAAAGALRWAVEGSTAWVPAMALIQPLHGLTFALFHLTAMRVLAAVVPPALAGTAQTVYGTAGIALPSAILTIASGTLYQSFGAFGFFAMVPLCVGAVLLGLGLREPRVVAAHRESAAA